MKRNWIVYLMITLLAACTPKVEETAVESKPDSQQVIAELNTFLDDWHQLAANADLAYFDKMASGGTFLGTDATENWSTAEFREWSARYFEEGEAWDFTPYDRSIYLSADGKYAWFDEMLDTWMGVCRGSGVLSNSGNDWEIAHYHLSMTIPNEVTLKVIELIEHEEKIAEEQE